MTKILFEERDDLKIQTWETLPHRTPVTASYASCIVVSFWRRNEGPNKALEKSMFLLVFLETVLPIYLLAFTL